MRFEPAVTPYLRPSTGVGQIMREVLFALVPAALAYLWYFGPGLIFNLIVAGVVASAAEALAQTLKRAAPSSALSDYSVAVTAVLLAFAMPPLTPWWVTATAAAFGVLVAKHLYGGIGYNLFNPAMAGYVVALVSFPLEMSAWIPPNIGDLDYEYLGFGASLGYVLTGQLPDGVTLDAITRATPLEQVKAIRDNLSTMDEVRAGPMFGDFGGRGWEWINNFIALGGLWLLFRRVIRWQIPVGVLAGVLIPATVMAIAAPGSHAGPAFHLFAGATLLGAFFIATDPVSAAASPLGRLIYGIGIGVLTWVIRTWGGYPDGMAFAVLLMNLAAPTIDRYTRPRVLGHER